MPRRSRERANRNRAQAQSDWRGQAAQRQQAQRERQAQEADRLRTQREQHETQSANEREPRRLDGIDRSREARRDSVPQRVARGEQERRIREQRVRAENYQRLREQQLREADRRSHDLQQQRRYAQYRYQQEYARRLREQQVRWSARNYDYYRDPYYYTPATYRYSYAGSWYQTNRYGADLMRQAVNYGYEEGLRAGRADRDDGWRYDYRNSYGYRDASYGYNGFYLGQDEYNYYFRQGFQRGYEDGYYSRYRYGRRGDDGNYFILAAVLGTILGLQLLN